MAKPNYQFEKRQRDIAKKKKQDEKRSRKLSKDEVPAEEGSEAAADLDAEAPGSVPAVSGSDPG